MEVLIKHTPAQGKCRSRDTKSIGGTHNVPLDELGKAFVGHAATIDFGAGVSRRVRACQKSRIDCCHYSSSRLRRVSKESLRVAPRPHRPGTKISNFEWRCPLIPLGVLTSGSMLIANVYEHMFFDISLALNARIFIQTPYAMCCSLRWRIIVSLFVP